MITEVDENYRMRVRLLRKLYGMTQAEWATFTGIPYKKWNHYERGYPVSRESQVILRVKLGISIDWLCFNDPSGMTIGMLAHLRALEQEERALIAKKKYGKGADAHS